MNSTVSTSASLIFALACSIPAIHAQPPAARHEAVNKDAQTLVDFKARVDQYVELRKKADDSAPPLKKTEDPREIMDAQKALVERIGAARAGAKQGDIFTPQAAKLFRRLLRPEATDKSSKAILKEDGPNPAAVSFKINGPYPEQQPLATTPPDVLAALPKLPQDLEYRFVGKHLILRDSRANTIIDYIPNAIP